MILPVRAARWTSLGRQLAMGAPVIAGAFGALILILVLFGMGAAIGYLLIAAPGSILLAGFVAKRLDRQIDLRGEPVVIDSDVVRIPGADGEVVFRRDRPLKVEPGWWNNATKEPGEPGVRDASRGVFLVLEQEGRAVILHADDSNARAWSHGVPFRKPATVPPRQVRVWAADLVRAIVALR